MCLIDPHRLSLIEVVVRRSSFGDALPSWEAEGAMAASASHHNCPCSFRGHESFFEEINPIDMGSSEAL